MAESVDRQSALVAADTTSADGRATAHSKRTKTMLIDGGTGSELRRRGIALAPQAWSAGAIPQHSNILTAIHLDYIAAGAELITANTFAATRFALDAAALGASRVQINETAIRAARSARHRALDLGGTTARAAERVLIAASLSCYPPGGDASLYPPPERELAAYRDNARLFADAGVDLILVEMVQDPVHGARICRAAAESGLPFWLGLSCRRDAGGGLVGFDLPGAGFVETLDALLEFHPAAIAVMHTPLDAIEAAIGAVRARFNGPVGAYPEVPYPEDPDFRTTLPDPGSFAPTSPAELVAAGKRWVAAGATIVGGCCGTTPAHIAALRAAIDAGEL